LQDLGDRSEAAHALIRLGEVAHVEGDFAVARRYYEAGVSLRDELGIGYPRASHCLGILALDCGDLVQARHWIVDCLRREVDGGQATWLHATLADLACLAAAEGRPERALYLAGAMEARCERAGATLQPTERPRFELWLGRARRALDAEAASVAWSRGRATPLERVIAEILGETTDEVAPTPPRPTAGSWSPLTRREQEVAELIAAGTHRDRDIAAALTIAETTAGLHVRRILAKLGLHSRWEIASWVNRTGRAGDAPTPGVAEARRG
jgi:non-specific serine/threonine protein kinase